MGNLTVQLAVAPCPAPEAKDATVTVKLVDSAGKPSAHGPITIKNGMESMNMTGSEKKVQPQGDQYTTSLRFGMGGKWDVRISVAGIGNAHFAVPVK